MSFNLRNRSLLSMEVTEAVLASECLYPSVCSRGIGWVRPSRKPGYWIEQELRNQLPQRDIVILLTQVEVDAADPAFQRPTNPPATAPVTP